MVTNIIRFKFKEEKLEDAKAFIKKSIDSHKGEPGLLRYESYFDNTDPTCFFHVKQFENQEALQKHNSSPLLQTFLQEFKQYLEEPPAYNENTLWHSLQEEG